MSDMVPGDNSNDAALAPLRDQIDAIDRELLALISRRAQLAEEVGRVKLASASAVYRPEREAEVLRSVTALNQGPLEAEALEPIFREIISACRAMERPLAIAYLGPPGTFSELAALRQFGSAVHLESCGSIDDVFRAAESGRSDYAVVPVENSTEGAVSRSLDLLLTTRLKIIAEVSIPIQHHLLARHSTLADVQRVFAHPQALAQCLTWLNQNLPSLERIHVASNAEAARQASLDAAAAAVAGESAARRYGLQIVARQIQDDPLNRTRFLVLGQQECPRTGQDKTSLILSVPNRVGAVYDMLAPLARHGVSMTRFESRPARTGAWEYYFYLDVEGHAADPAMGAALEELARGCAFFRCLGSYPRAVV
jgi:chorismate mutase / prephenate dehydratase